MKRVISGFTLGTQRLRSPAFFGAMAFLTAVMAMMPRLSAQTKKPTDYQVKAVYLYNFGRFVEWPDKLSSSQDPFIICILGHDPFGQALDATLGGETIAGRAVVTKRIATPQESLQCRIIFVGETEAGSVNRLMAAVERKAVLTVSDLPQFTDRGGIIQFVTEGDRVRFEVNLSAAQNAGLVLSSELLKVAAVVRRSSASGER